MKQANKRKWVIACIMAGIVLAMVIVASINVFANNLAPPAQDISSGNEKWDQLTGNPSVIVTSAVGRAGEEATLSVLLENNPGISLFRLTMKYDERLSFVSAAPGDILTHHFYAHHIAANREVGVSATSSGQGDVMAGGIVFTITFKIDEGVQAGEISLELGYFDEYDAFVSNYKLMQFEIAQQGKITVSSSVYGDFTGNGRVDATDILWIRRYIVAGRSIAVMKQVFGPTTIDTFNESMADITNNGIVDASDILWIQRYIVSGRDVDVMIIVYNPIIDFSHLRANTGTAGETPSS